MLHSKQISFPAGKTEATSKFTRFKVNQGLIYRIWITFPAGCQNLVNLRILHEGHPFLPVDKDSFITGDNYTFVYPIFYEIKEEPAQIVVQGWNTDDTFVHVIDIQFLIIDKAFVQPIGATEGIIAALRSIFNQR